MNKFLILFIIVLTGCAGNKRCDLKIELDSLTMNLTRDERYDQEAPPQLYFKFSVSELNSKLDSYLLANTSSMSKVLIVDTMLNQVIPVSLGSTAILIEQDVSYFTGHINIDEHSKYFDLDSNFFYRLDFSSEKELLLQKCKDMLNRSLLIYMNSEDPSSAQVNFMEKDDCRRSLIILKPIY